MQYRFKRDIFYEVKDKLSKSRVLCLTGPRKCGKTVCLLQLTEELPRSVYYNCKSLSKRERLRIFENVRSSIKNCDDTIYLIDEVTYADMPELEIQSVAMAYTENPEAKTKVVFSGSQSVAIKMWVSSAFGGTAQKITTDFLSYAEWLRYKGYNEATEDNFYQFLTSVSDFYGFTTIEEYVEDCLTETVISNQKTSNVILGNDCDLITKELLLNVCHTTLFTLHNHVGVQSYMSGDKLYQSISHYFVDVCDRLGNSEIKDRIANSFVNCYSRVINTDVDSLRQAFLLLANCGLITLTPVLNRGECFKSVHNDLKFEMGSIQYKKDLFSRYNMCITYPMFYVSILQEILKKDMPEKLPNSIVGSIVECYVRSLLDIGDYYEYRDSDGNEIDYVNISRSLAVEITIANKRDCNVRFEFAPENVKRVLLTKNVTTESKGIYRIPYYEFIRILGEHKDLRASIEKITKMCESDDSEEAARNLLDISK